MRIFLFRLFGCAAGLLIGCYLFGIELAPHNAALCILLLAAVYTFIRPLVSLLILPLNVFVLGILSLFTDALIIRLVTGWCIEFTYWQALFAAAVIAVCFLPYEKARQSFRL